MTDDTEYEFTTGRVGFELDLFLSNDSGRAKHVDLTEQGALLMEPVARGLRALPSTSGVAFGQLHYRGEVPDAAPDRFSIEVGQPDESFDADVAAGKIRSLISLAVRLGRLTNQALAATGTPKDVLTEFAAPPNGRNFIARDLIRLLNAIDGDKQLEDAEWSVWTDAFNEIRESLDQDE